MDYFVGIDGGGTKTAFCSYDTSGNLLASCELPTCHVRQVSSDEAQAILKAGAVQVLPELASDDRVFVGCGLAGFGENQELRARIQDYVAKSFKDWSCVLANDAQVGLLGALDGNEGIFVIAGTGSMGLSYADGHFTRCGGWGFELGDEASAYWMGKRLLQLYTHQADGRMPKTQLMDFVNQKLGLSNSYDLIGYMAKPEHSSREGVASLALCVYELAQAGDKAALLIYKEAAEQLSLMINTLAKQFKTPIQASYTGSVWKGIEFLEPHLHLQDHVMLEKPVHDPCYGAFLLAKTLVQMSYKTLEIR